MKKKKIKINFFLLIRYFYPLSIFIIVVVLAALFAFLYKNVYQTLAQAETLTELKQKVSEEKLQKEKFNEIIENIENKSQRTDISQENLKNIFNGI